MIVKETRKSVVELIVLSSTGVNFLFVMDPY